MHTATATDTEPNPSVINAVHALLNVCDGAATPDKRGFNKWDSGVAQSLTDRHAWSPRQTRMAWHMLRKYKGQLSGMGIDYDEIPEPPIPEKRREVKQITWEGGKFVIRFDYDIRLVSYVKEFPSKMRRFNPNSRTWEVEANIDTTERLSSFVSDYDFDATDEVLEKMQEITSGFTRSVEMSKAESADLEIPGLIREPFPFQKAGVKYMVEKKKVINGADMGLGKSGQTLMALELTQAYPALVICPASVKYNWAREVELWLKGRSVEVINGKPGAYSADITVINYDILAKHMGTLETLGIRTLAVDEFHKIKSSTAKRSKLVRQLAGNVEYCFLLSGTPIPNRYKELIFPLEVIGKIDEFGGTWRFLTHFCGAYRTRFGLEANGSQHGEELNAKLRASCMWRVMKTDVLKELPPKLHSTLEFRLSNEKEYRRAENELGKFLGERAVKDAEFLASIAHLPEDEQEEAKHSHAKSAEEKAERAKQLVMFTTLRQLAALGTMDSIKEWIEDHFEEGNEKLIIGAWHQEVIDKILEILPSDTPKITGEIDARKRQEHVDRFQNDPNCRFIVCNIQAGGVGITLTAASNSLIVEPPWNPGDLEQFEDRIFRIGQTANCVNIYNASVPNTVYDDMYGLIQEKRDAISTATSQETPFLQRFQQRIQKGK